MALERLDVRGLGDRLDAALPRPAPDDDVTEAVAAIVAEVRRDGDDALRVFTSRFDGVEVVDFRVPSTEVEAALGRVPEALREALEVAHKRIVAYHELDVAEPIEFSSDGVRVTDLVRPMARVGCYAPGGRARYPSTVLMCATPARVAGVRELVLCVPPGAGGAVDDATLAAAAIAGIDEVYRVGGAQAVAALAYGTPSIGRVDAIVGPGNAFVAEAMRQVAGVVGIPAAFAGPSEVLVVAGPETDAGLAAVDLAVQAEHGPGGLSWLVSWSEDKLAEVDRALEEVVAASP
ncbi:MAG: histidinol dehydrogenase, partial [Acidimicrobiales bacterium]